MDGKLITDTIVGKRRVTVFKNITNIKCEADYITFDTCDRGRVRIYLDNFNRFELHRRAL